MSFPPEDIKPLVQRIAKLLLERKQTIAISEAACGGLLSAYIVSLPGASNFYIGSKLVYSLKQRLKLSGWTDEEISNYTGPSEQVVLKLARTTRFELGSSYVLSESGFAGPSVDLHLDSDSSSKNDSKSVGTVYLAVSGPKGEVSRVRSSGSVAREVNMAHFAKLGLEFLLEVLENDV